MGVQCPDYLNYVQLSLFPAFFEDAKDSRKPFSPKKKQARRVAEAHGPEQILLFESCFVETEVSGR